MLSLRKLSGTVTGVVLRDVPTTIKQIHNIGEDYRFKALDSYVGVQISTLLVALVR